MQSDKLDRRQFIKSGVGVAAMAAGFGTLSNEVLAQESAVAPKKIPERPFGKTGRTLPILGHGGSALMEREYGYYHLTQVPTREERVAMIRRAYDLGVRYFDTARIYAESENLFGEALRDVREDTLLASKVLVDGAEKVRPSVEASLEALGMDRIDTMQVHGPSIERLKYEGAMKLAEELVKLRDEGIIRYIGMTGHNAFDEMHKMISTGGFDTVLIEYGYFKKGYNTRHSETQVAWRDACLAAAHERDMGIVAMKVLGAWVFNHNAQNMAPEFDPERVKQLPGAAMRWVLSDPRVHILNIGISWPGDIEKNIEILTGDTTLTNEDRLLLAEFSAAAYQHQSIQEMPVV